MGDLRAEPVFFTEFYPDDLNDVVSVTVGFGESVFWALQTRPFRFCGQETSPAGAL
jgi:hypothetical protein